MCTSCRRPLVPSWVTAGVGTALKPASEYWWLARKPLSGTVAQTVLAHGCGALNIDATRVGTGGQLQWEKPRDMGYRGGSDAGPVQALAATQGRWPSNVVFSHGEDCVEDGPCVDGCPVAELDAQSGVTASSTRSDRSGPGGRRGGIMGEAVERVGPRVGHGDSGGASRFFPVFRYQAKAPARERPKVNGVAHPTVKPVSLMSWLVRLVCPPGGTVLDPFAGSGTTVEACLAEGVRCAAIEREAEYLPLIHARIDRAEEAS